MCLYQFPSSDNLFQTYSTASQPGYWLGSSPGEGNGYPLQYSCLENSIDRGAWRATVHGVTKSQTRLSADTCLAGWAGLRELESTTLLNVLKPTSSGCVDCGAFPLTPDELMLLPCFQWQWLIWQLRKLLLSMNFGECPAAPQDVCNLAETLLNVESIL